MIAWEFRTPGLWFLNSLSYLFGRVPLEIMANKAHFKITKYFPIKHIRYSRSTLSAEITLPVLWLRSQADSQVALHRGVILNNTKILQQDHYRVYCLKYIPMNQWLMLWRRNKTNREYFKYKSHCNNPFGTICWLGVLSDKANMACGNHWDTLLNMYQNNFQHVFASLIIIYKNYL